MGCREPPSLPVSASRMPAQSLFQSRPTMPPAASDAITFRAPRPDDAPCLAAPSTQVFLDTYATQGIRRAVANEALALHSVAAYEALLADAA